MSLILAELFFLLAPLVSMAGEDEQIHTFEIGETDFLLDGQPMQIRCGEIHYARVPREYWKHRIEMIRATGMNAVCVYLFWNYHERVEGEFTWEGQADVAEFCRLAQEAGLWVVLRPGPYSCAEWEMGGLPWWLLKDEDIALRTRDKRFVTAVRRYFKEVGKELGPLQVNKGGPILMAQVENEYGFFSDDALYMAEMKQALIDAGFEVPLFACNPPYHIQNGYDSDLFQVVNFGSDPVGAFEALREIQSDGPLMCGEFYPAWFDTWGAPHHDGDPEQYIGTLDEMMAMGASYSIYMVHGGTSFGFWSGADRPFKPDTSSYDYDAPVSEAGWPTDGFYRLREMVQKHLPDGEMIPQPPEMNPVIGIDPIRLDRFAGFRDNLGPPIRSESPLNFEKIDAYRGGVLYETTLKAGPPATLRAEAIHDFAWVFIDGKQVGVTDRRSRSFEVSIPERKKESKLELLVWSMGRINFGPEIHDRKGIHGPVVLIDSSGNASELRDWVHYPMTFEEQSLNELRFFEKRDSKKAGPGFWKASFYLEESGDTFIDMSFWGKGVVWVNGHALGRFWNIGPTQTMYLPGPWLKAGENEVLIFDLVGPTDPTIRGLRSPILDNLRPELDFAGPRRPLSEIRIEGHEPVQRCKLEAHGQMEVIRLNTPAEGEFVAFKILSSYRGTPTASIGEIDLLNTDGELIPHSYWTIAYVSSEERYEIDGTAENAIDGQTASIWSSQYAHNAAEHPHVIVINLGRTETIEGIRYVPGSAGGSEALIEDMEIYIGNDLVKYHREQ